MNRTLVPWEYTTNVFFAIPRRVLASLILLIWCVAALAQSASHPPNGPASVSTRATHLMGFAGAPCNAKGTLSIQDNVLQFQKGGEPAVEVKIASVQDVFLGEQGRQVGGVPMTLGKAAVPFGGGRVVSLFAHKKYDTLTLEYVDANGGLHGAIFQLLKGQGGDLRDELVARGAHVSQTGSEATKQGTPEASNENE
jgi:hypothetical protein